MAIKLQNDYYNINDANLRRLYNWQFGIIRLLVMKFLKLILAYINTLCYY